MIKEHGEVGVLLDLDLDQSRKQSNYLPLQSRQIKLHPTRFFSWIGYSSFHKNSNRYSCMRNEQWLYYEIFSVFGQRKNLWMDKIASENIYNKFRETEVIGISVTASCVNSLLIMHERMYRWIWNLKPPTYSTLE